MEDWSVFEVLPFSNGGPVFDLARRKKHLLLDR